MRATGTIRAAARAWSFRHEAVSRAKSTLAGARTGAPSGTGGVELTFLGTASQGGARRYPSSLSMRLHGAHGSEVWLFDAGEGALAQLQRSSMRVSLVRNIFITHLHGDHLYGLPSLVLSVLRSRAPDSRPEPLDVYGPQGLRGFLRMALGVAGLRMPARHALRIHELAWPDNFSTSRFRGGGHCKTKVKRLPYEGLGRDLHAVDVDGTFTYELLGVEGEERPATVVAAPVLHTVPTFAYAVAERVTKRRFDKERLEGLGVALDGSARDVFQKWLGGGVVELDGRSWAIDDVMRTGREPRRVCVVGDTYDAGGCAHIAQGCDVLVHEATNAAAQSAMARVRGHSSTSGACGFGKRVGAKRLILNHVSVSYSERKIRSLEMEARSMFGAQKAFVARDLSQFSVPTCEEDGENFVFRRFAGYANSEEARQAGDGPFGRELEVGVDECEAGEGLQWGEGEAAEIIGEVHDAEEDSNWEGEEDQVSEASVEDRLGGEEARQTRASLSAST